MTLPAKLDDISALPDQIREHYREHDGHYVLDVAASDDGYGLENIAGLRSALEKERAAKSNAAKQAAELQRRVEAFGDLDPDEARSALEKITSGTLTGKDELAKREAAVTKKLQEKYASEIKERDDRIAKMEAGHRNTTIRAEAVEAAAKASINPRWIMPHIDQITDMRYVEAENGEMIAQVVVLNEHGEPRVSLRDASGNMTIEEYITDVMASDPDFKDLFGLKGRGTGGSDRPGGKSKASVFGNATDPAERFRLARRARSTR